MSNINDFIIESAKMPFNFVKNSALLNCLLKPKISTIKLLIDVKISKSTPLPAAMPKPTQRKTTSHLWRREGELK